ncbi:Prominin-1-A [Holothuria leucospilota]|uniref:Prominin-1-A n=1 Tax=Holothuria leucospilota TaxID=206669 RepID=A0A9Q0YN71_HOLLE|nr:Prominin-1-A [Holothuria leucospilota]
MKCTAVSLSLVWTVLAILAFMSFCRDGTTTEGAVDPRVDGDGNIVWGNFDPIPPSNLDNSFESISRPQIVVNMAHNFGVLVVNGLPYDAIRQLLYGIQDGSLNGNSEIYWQLAGGFVGVIILILFGIILFLLVPIIGLCFCTCRCCGKCGGKRTQVDSNLGCMRVTLPGMAFTNSANDFQRGTLQAADDVFYTATDGFNNYTKDVLKQVEYMVDVQYMFVDNLIRENLTENTIGKDVTEYIRKDLRVGEVEDSLNTISADLKSAEIAMTGLQSGRNELVQSERQLESNLTSIEAEIQSINDSCGNCLKPFDIVVESNFTLLPEVSDDEISDIGTGASSVEEATNEIDTSLTAIENELEAATNESVKQALDALDATKVTVEDAFTGIEDAVKKIENAIKDVQRDVDTIVSDYNQYVDYGWYFFIAVSCTILFILVVMILGFTMGTICYSRGSPLDRSKMSNAGGNCLMAAVFFMFLFFPILILLTCIFFGVVSVVTSTCDPLTTLELYKETVDYPNTIIPGYFLGDVLYDNSSYPVTFSGALESCQENHTLYNAVMMEYAFNFNELKQEFEKLEEEFDKFIGDIEDIPLNFDVFPDDLGNMLSSLVEEVGLSDFDADAYTTVLSQSILSEPTLNSYADYLDEKADNHSGQSTEMQKAASDLRNIQTSLVSPMEATVDEMENDVDTVNGVATSLPGNVNDTIKLLKEVETAIGSVNETEVAKNVTQVYVDALIAYGDSFIAQTENQVTNEFAGCRNIWDIYSLTLQYSCDNVLDSWNSIWFTIGWCTFFFLPSIIVSVKLAKHYRIMNKVLPPKPKKQKNTRSPDEEVGMNEMNGYHSNAYDERLLYQDGGRGGMTPVDNPQFVQDEPIMAYDYRGNPIAPPPAYNYGEEFRNPLHNSYF